MGQASRPAPLPVLAPLPSEAACNRIPSAALPPQLWWTVPSNCETEQTLPPLREVFEF